MNPHYIQVHTILIPCMYDDYHNVNLYFTVYGALNLVSVATFPSLSHQQHQYSAHLLTSGRGPVHPTSNGRLTCQPLAISQKVCNSQLPIKQNRIILQLHPLITPWRHHQTAWPFPGDSSILARLQDVTNSGNH